jgi:hypothetical protein
MQSLSDDIENELTFLDKTILDDNKKLLEAETQKEFDRKAYENYIKREDERKSKTWLYNFNHSAPEVVSYKGIFHTYMHKLDGSLTPFYTGGSESAYLLKIDALQQHERKYVEFTANFNRGKMYNDGDYLRTVHNNIKSYNMKNRESVNL